MKLNSDNKSIDEIAATLWVSNISTLLQWIQNIRDLDLSDWKSIDHNIQVLSEAVKRLTEAQIYAFYCYDELAENLNDDMSRWIRFWERVWNNLSRFWGIHKDEYSIVTPDELDYLELTQKNHTVYTWDLLTVDDFLWLKSSDPIISDDNESETYDLTYEILWPQETELLESLWIKVQILDTLV